MRKFCWIYQRKCDSQIWLIMKPRLRSVSPLWIGITYDSRGHQLPTSGFPREHMRRFFSYVGKL